MTTIIPIDIDHIAWAKAFLMRAGVWKSSLLDEALAAGFGFKSHAALRAALPRPSIVEASLDLDVFAQRLGDPESRHALALALCALQMAPGDAFTEIAHQAEVTRRLNHVASCIVWWKPHLARPMIDRPPMASPPASLAPFCKGIDMVEVSAMDDDGLMVLLEEAYESSDTTFPSKKTPSIVRRLGLGSAYGYEAVQAAIEVLESQDAPILPVDALEVADWIAAQLDGIEDGAGKRKLVQNVLSLVRWRFPPVARDAAERHHFEGPWPWHKERGKIFTEQRGRYHGDKHAKVLIEKLARTGAKALRMTIESPYATLTLNDGSVRIPGSTTSPSFHALVLSGAYQLGYTGSPNMHIFENLARTQTVTIRELKPYALPVPLRRLKATFVPRTRPEDGSWARDMTVELIPAVVDRHSFVEDVKSNMTPEQRSKAGRTYDDMHFDMRWGESVLDVAVIMVRLARLSLAIEGFPRNVSFSPYKDHPPVFEADFHDGRWNLVATQAALEKINEGAARAWGSREDFVRIDVLKALKLPETRYAMDELREILTWGPDPMQDLRDLAPLLPTPSMHSILEEGSEGLRDLGILKGRDEKADLSMAKSVVEIAQAVGVGAQGVTPERRHPEDTRFWRTPLQAAAADGDMGFVEALLQAGAKVHLPNVYLDPLDAAVCQGHASAVRRLLDAGADAGKLDEEGCSRLISLSVSIPDSTNVQHVTAIARMLLDAGTDPAVRTDIRSNGARMNVANGTAMDALAKYLDPDNPSRRFDTSRYMREERLTAARELLALLNDATTA